MKIYIAGPMRGIPEWNYPAFAKARQEWKEKGHQVFCPAAISEALGYKIDEPCEPQNGKAHLLHVILSDILCLSNADAIGLLPGWEKSRGATVELAFAQLLGLQVFDTVTMQEIKPAITPWAGILELSRVLYGRSRDDKRIFNPLLK